MEGLDKTQQEFVLKYQAIHSKLGQLESQMKEIQLHANELIEELESLRDQENKLYNQKKENNG